MKGLLILGVNYFRKIDDVVEILKNEYIGIVMADIDKPAIYISFEAAPKESNS